MVGVAVSTDGGRGEYIVLRTGHGVPKTYGDIYATRSRVHTDRVQTSRPNVRALPVSTSLAFFISPKRACRKRDMSENKDKTHAQSFSR